MKLGQNSLILRYQTDPGYIIDPIMDQENIIINLGDSEQYIEVLDGSRIQNKPYNGPGKYNY